MIRVAIVIVFLMVAWNAVAGDKGRVLEYSAYPNSTNNFAEATFAGVIPTPEPRAILFLAGGTDSDARPWLEEPLWRAFAEKEHLILIAACLRGAGQSYEVASDGSGQALLDAMAAFARESGRAKLNRLPLILYGHSAGAQFGYSFACWKPDRVHAIVCVKSGPLQPPPKGQPAAFQALFIVGERDQPGRTRTVAQAFAAGRSMGTPWCLAIQPRAGHGTEGSRGLVESFISATLASRPADQDYAELSTLQSRQKEAGATNDPNCSWLPTSSFANDWRGFVKSLPLAPLLTLPEVSRKEFTSMPITPLPARIEQSGKHVGFEYLVSFPETITDATINSSHPAVTATMRRQSEREWRVSGDFDLTRLPLGPFRSHLRIAYLAVDGSHEKGELPLFIRITGPVSAVPASLYYGVVARDAKVTMDLVIKGDGRSPIVSCETVPPTAASAIVTISASEKAGEFRVRCILNAGTRIGEHHGNLTFRVVTDRTNPITVPFYGFVKK